MLLSGEDDATHLLAAVDEAAVRRALAMSPEEEAREQLKHLRDVSLRRNVSLRIIPSDAGLHPGMLGMFTVFQFTDDIDRDVVHVETHSGDRYLEERSSVLEYLRLFDTVTHRALDNTASRELLDRLLAACRHP